MRLSKYLVLHAKKNCGYIFNTRKETITVVSPTLLEKLEQTDIKAIPAGVRMTLIRQGVLVLDKENETDQVRTQILTRREHHDLRLVLVPTYSCNLKCSYCYADNVTGERFKSVPQWEDGIAEFIKKRLAAKEHKGLTIALFGGEPLLKATVCYKVLKSAKAVMDDFGGSIYRTLTTNGSIFNHEVDQLLTEIDYCQVTLDGVGAEHDRHRKFETGGGTYQRIILFLQKAIEKGCKTTIRFHLHDYDANFLRHCATRLRKELHATTKVSIYFSKVAAGCYSETLKCSFRKDYTSNGITPHEHARDLFYAAGWPLRQLFLHDKGNSGSSCSTRCGYIGTESFLIDGENNIFFCPVALKNRQLRIGKLNQKGYHFFPLRDRLLFDFRIAPQCRDCPLLPLCEQGCPTKALVNNRRPDSAYCEKKQILSNVKHRCETTQLPV